MKLKFVKKSDYNAEITELENKILSISGLVTTSTLATVEAKSPSVSKLLRKQIMIQKLVKLQRNFLILSMKNVLLLQNLTAENFIASKFNNKNRFWC